jgi:eukaryotic-like serine/threonine-protein kinase
MDALIRGRYRLLRPLGAGGQGTAHLAEDASSGVQVVVKRLRLGEVHDWSQVELFERESRVLRTLSHPSIPRYIDSFALEDGPQREFVLVQEYVDAPCLDDLVRSGWHATEAEVRELGTRLLEIVAYLQSLRPPIVHRDISPRNVLRAGDGRVHLVDFGGVQDALRLQGPGGTTVIGTPGYAPPEQVLGRATVRSDLYGAAATILFVLTHRNPADLPAVDLKPDFASVLDVSRPLARVLDSYLEADERKRDLPVGDAIALLQGRQAPLPAATPAGEAPYGSRIRAADDGTRLRLAVPEGPPGLQGLAIGGFAVVWLGFIAFWTFMAIGMGAPIVFPLFSIPFWAVGVFLLYRAVNSFFGWTEIVLDRTTMSISRRLFSFARVMNVPLAEVGEARVAVTASSSTGQQTSCVIAAGALSVPVAGSLSEREKEWLCDTLNAALDERRPRPGGKR